MANPFNSALHVVAGSVVVPFLVGPMLRTPPWKMCRSCHRVGTRHQYFDRCKHTEFTLGDCGQCGKRRPLVTCHQYDFTRSAKPTAAPKVSRPEPIICPTCGRAGGAK